MSVSQYQRSVMNDTALKHEFVQIYFNGNQTVSTRAHCLVFGVIRSHQQKLSMIIPSPIYFLCLMFYYVQKLFGKHSTNIKVSGDQDETILLWNCLD